LTHIKGYLFLESPICKEICEFNGQRDCKNL
jgi:hypothetical protein